MGPLKLSLVIVGFFVVAALVFLAGSFLADYIFGFSARHDANQANAAAVIVPIYFLARFVVCPIASIAAGAVAAWRIAKSDLSL